MPFDPVHLLRNLEPPVRPSAAPAPHRAPGTGAPLEQQGFDELMALVSRGSVHSERPIVVAPGATRGEIEPAQLERLAAAADLAEASGAQRAVMLLDGRGLVVDVAARTVTAELASSGAERLVAIDAAVFVAGDDDAPVDAAVTGLGLGAGVVPAAIARYLEEAESGRPNDPEPRARGAG